MSDTSSSGSYHLNQEPLNKYKKGGYCPIAFNEILGEKYLVTKKVGWGGFSTVWSTSCGKVLKVIRSAKTYVESAKEEITILKHLDDDAKNKHISYLVDTFEHESRNGIHLVMVFEKYGVTVLHLLKEYRFNGLPYVLVETAYHNLLLALNYLHDKNIIHGDIKPENILLKDTNNPEAGVILTDFSNSTLKNNPYDGVLETEAYRSPESIIRVYPYTEKIDIWSLGCTIFELLTGDILFYAEDDDDHLALMIGMFEEGSIVFNCYRNTSRYYHHYFDLTSGMLQDIANIRYCSLKLRLKKTYEVEEPHLTKWDCLISWMLTINYRIRPSSQKLLEYFEKYC